MMNDIKFKKAFAAITQMTDKYVASGRLTEAMAKSVLEAMAGKDLHIAVIGKMKAGKSTFTNALIFKEPILPSGAEPTTVTLTEIVYTDDKDNDNRVDVELLSSEDIEALKINAKSEDPKISGTAQSILKEIENIPGGYQQYISKGTVSIELDELIEFTSSTGKFNGLAKKVTIHKHLPSLCGLRITDTPGFNDPINSRGKATREALKDSHIILFVHDYLDKYDQDEISILQEQVEYTGVSMLVDVVNKMDANEDLELDDWSSYVEKFDRKKSEAIKQIHKDGVKELLSKSITSYVSALMALIGYEMTRYNHMKADGKDYNLSEEVKDFYIQYQIDFPELNNAEAFINYSNVASIVKIINKLSEDKSQYLAKYPVQTLIGLLKSVVEAINQDLGKLKSELDILEASTADAKRQLDAINQTFRALGGKINSPVLATTLRECIRDTKHEIQRERDSISTTEFVPENYENDKMFGTGPEKRNISRYRGILSDFDNKIRERLESLKDNFKTKSEDHVRRHVTEGLSIEVTNSEDRKNLSALIIGLLVSEISKGLPIVVNPDEPSDYLYGYGTQASIYKSDFNERRKDSVIDDNYLKVFNSFVDNTISSDVLRNAIADQIEDLKSTLKNALNFSPAEKEEERRRLKQDIKNLEEEINVAKQDIKKLEEIK